MYQSVLGHQTTAQGSEPCWKDFTLHTLSSVRADAGIATVVLEPQAGPAYYQSRTTSTLTWTSGLLLRRRAARSRAAAGEANLARSSSLQCKRQRLVTRAAARIGLVAGLVVAAGMIAMFQRPSDVAARPMIDPMPPAVTAGIASQIENLRPPAQTGVLARLRLALVPKVRSDSALSLAVRNTGNVILSPVRTMMLCWGDQVPPGVAIPRARWANLLLSSRVIAEAVPIVRAVSICLLSHASTTLLLVIFLSHQIGSVAAVFVVVALGGYLWQRRRVNASRQSLERASRRHIRARGDRSLAAGWDTYRAGQQDEGRAIHVKDHSREGEYRRCTPQT